MKWLYESFQIWKNKNDLKIYKCYLGVDFTRYFLGFLLFGVSFVACISLAVTPSHDAPQSLFVALWCTTATVLQKAKTGRITACAFGSYNCWIRNYGFTGGFCVWGNWFYELWWGTLRNY